MEKHEIILDDYLHGYRKFLVFYLLIVSVFGAINYLSNPVTILDFVFGLILLTCIYILSVTMIGKKGLYILNDKLYRGITVGGKFLLKQKVDLVQFSKFSYNKKEKTNLPRFLEYSSFGFFSNHHECSIYLIDSSNVKNNKKIISFSNFEDYHDLKEFLLKWTALKEFNRGTVLDE